MNRSSITFWALGKRYGFNLNKMIEFVNENQYWSDEQIHDYQLERLKIIIAHAYENVRFYQEHMRKMGMEPNDFTSIKDLQHFPLIDKYFIAQNHQDFIATNYLKFKPMERSTGGTTGVPFKYYNDTGSWGLNWATKIRTFSWGNYNYGTDKVIEFKGGSMLRKGAFSPKVLFWRFLQNSFTVPIMNMTNESMREIYKLIKKKNISVLRGYPSSLYTFAKYLDVIGERYDMNGIFTTAEMLYDYQRDIIEKVFSCKIIDAYGCGDGMAGANQCEHHDKYHVNIETSYMELLDDAGNNVTSGEEGEVVLTSLHGFAMPFIRYKPGDIAIKGSSNCGCGRSLPVLDKIIGRSSDLIELPNGRILNGLSIPFESWSDEIERFQLIQEEKDILVLNLVPKPSFSRQHEQKIRDLLEYNAGEGIRIIINQVDHIEQTGAGKFRYIISKVQK